MRLYPGQLAVKCQIQLTPATPAFLGWKVKRLQQLSRTPTSQMFTYPTQWRGSCAAITSLHGLGVGAERASWPWPQPQPELPGRELFPEGAARGGRWQGGSHSLNERAQRGRAAGAASPLSCEHQLGQVSGGSRRAGVLWPCSRLLLLQPARPTLLAGSWLAPGSMVPGRWRQDLARLPSTPSALAPPGALHPVESQAQPERSKE